MQYDYFLFLAKAGGFVVTAQLLNVIVNKVLSQPLLTPKSYAALKREWETSQKLLAWKPVVAATEWLVAVAPMHSAKSRTSTSGKAAGGQSEDGPSSKRMRT